MPRKSSVQGAADDVPAPRKRRIYLPAAERKKSIISAAQKVFSQSNLKGARTRDIAREAQVNQATIFEHFASKEALFQEAVILPLIEAMQGMHGRVEVYEATNSPEELAQAAEESTRCHLDSMMSIFPLLTAALFSDLETGRALYQEHIAPLIQQRGEVLRPLVKDGVDPEFVGLANFGMLFAIAMDRCFRGIDSDLGPLASQFNRLSTTGFARDKSKIATRSSTGEEPTA